MGLYFDSVFSAGSDAHDRAKRSTSNHSTNFSPHLPGKARRLQRLVRQRSTSAKTTLIQAGVDDVAAAATPASDSLLFRLPLSLRQKIYGYVVGQGEVLHIMMKRGARTTSHSPRLAYRRCHAGGNFGHCALQRCRQFLDVVDGGYYGSFDRVGELLFTCRDVYHEARTVLYGHNTFDFDHPLTCITFRDMVSPQSLHIIRSVSFEPQQRLCARTLWYPATRSDRDLWIQMWSTLLEMDALEELRVRVRFRPVRNGWVGIWGNDILDSMRTFPKPLKIFDVELPRITTGSPHETDGVAVLPK